MSSCDARHSRLLRDSNNSETIGTESASSPAKRLYLECEGANSCFLNRCHVYSVCVEYSGPGQESETSLGAQCVPRVLLFPHKRTPAMAVYGRAVRFKGGAAAASLWKPAATPDPMPAAPMGAPRSLAYTSPMVVARAPRARSMASVIEQQTTTPTSKPAMTTERSDDNATTQCADNR